METEAMERATAAAFTPNANRAADFDFLSFATTETCELSCVFCHFSRPNATKKAKTLAPELVEINCILIGDTKERMEEFTEFWRGRVDAVSFHAEYDTDLPWLPNIAEPACAGPTTSFATCTRIRTANSARSAASASGG
jgi:hypothetical protein